METVSFILSLLFFLLSATGLFVAYFFWVSKDGELRKIMIVKHICLSFMFLVFGIMVHWNHPNRIFAVMAVAPYLLSILRLLKYLFGLTKVK